MPRFSILIPAYNAAQKLRRTLDSVAAQHCPDWECLCCDDGSTDETAAIIAGYAARDKRFQLLKHERNRGGLCARNTLARAAQGAYSTWLDADDEIEPELLSTAAELLAHEPWDVIDFPYRHIIVENGCEIAHPWHFYQLHEENLIDFFFTRKCQVWYLWGKVIRTEVLKNALPPEDQLAGISLLDDTFFCLPLYYGAKDYVAPDTKPMYRYYTGGTWSSVKTVQTLERFQNLCDVRSRELEFNLSFLRRHGFGNRYDGILIALCDLPELEEMMLRLEKPEERQAALAFLRQRFRTDLLPLPRTQAVRRFSEEKSGTRATYSFVNPVWQPQKGTR